LLAHTIKVSAAYRPRCYNGLVHLFMCTDDPLTEGFSADLDPRLKWRQLVAEVRVVELTGGHEGILEVPYIYELADRLNQCIGSGRG